MEDLDFTSPMNDATRALETIISAISTEQVIGENPDHARDVLLVWASLLPPAEA
jgi:hypothetical protein